MRLRSDDSQTRPDKKHEATVLKFNLLPPKRESSDLTAPRDEAEKPTNKRKSRENWLATEASALLSTRSKDTTPA
jgi:hypothetical protein